MAWWHRDSSLWCRSPLHRYSRRVLRDNEALLRCRSFSKSQPTSAQHKEDDDGKRPEGLSNLEWLQLQHYRRWKRRLQEDPYRALFGASNDMLSGRGLKDWEWIYKAFPKWMLKEMDFPEHPEKPKREASKADKTDGSKATYSPSPPPQSSTTEVYPRKVEFANEDRPKGRESFFSEPSFRPSKLERSDYTREVISPSDLRRPRAQTTPREEPQVANDSTAQVKGTPTTGALEKQRFVPNKGSRNLEDGNEPTEPSSKDTETSRDTAANRDSAFIGEFFAEPPNLDITVDSKANDWRRTVLDRRLAPSVLPPSKDTTTKTTEKTPANLENDIDESASKTVDGSISTPLGYSIWLAISSRGQLPLENQSPAFPASPLSSSQTPNATTETILPAGSIVNNHTLHHLASKNPSATLDSDPARMTDNANNKTESSVTSRTTSDILRQLPEDDIDFLSAEEIRASMGVKRTTRESFEQRTRARAQLEKNFKDTQKKEVNLDPMFESKVVDDQHMRRTSRLLEAEQKLEHSIGPEREGSKAEVNFEARPTETAAHDLPIETSIDRMTKWLQAGGDSFAKHFWSEPVQAENPGLHQYKSIAAGVQASRTAMTHVEETLKHFLPASKPLLARLKENEASLLQAIGPMLRPRTERPMRSVEASSIGRIRKIRNNLKKTEEEFDDACKALDAVKGGEIKALSERSKAQLRTSFVVAQKNSKLTRRLVFKVQALEEKMRTEQRPARFPDVKNHLSALQDTQLALLRLIERLLQTFGVSPEATELRSEAKLQPSATLNIPGLLSGYEESTSSSRQDSGFMRGPVAEKQLENEVQAQKSAMRGLSDDGYARPPKPVRRTSFDGTSPLAHSLFRPFGPQLESLGKDVKTPSEKREDQACRDRELVQEIKESYEDVYGPITIGHHQGQGKPESTAVPVTGDNVALSHAQDQQNAAVSNTSELPVESETSLDVEASSDRSFSESRSPIHAEAAQVQVIKASANDVATNTEPSAFAAKPVPLTPVEEYSQASAAWKDDIFAAREYLLSGRPRSYLPGESLKSSTPVEMTYKILAYDPSTEEMHITTTTSKAMPASGASIPVHEALAVLDVPAKFVPHISSGFEIVTSKANLLVLRESSAATEEIVNSGVHNENEIRDEEWKRVNPVDGTTRLSPTGFVGVEPDLRDEHDASQRRKYYESWRAENEQREGRREEGDRERRKGGPVAGVFKTAIVASACCYVVGVVGELLR